MVAEEAQPDGFRLFSRRLPSKSSQSQPKRHPNEDRNDQNSVKSSQKDTCPDISQHQVSKDIQEENNQSSQSNRITKSFVNLGLAEFLVKSLRAVSIHAPTPVQQACIPEILAGRNVIASAKTGSGKTAAFALPIIQKLSADPYGIFALVLSPTRELAFQIAEQFKVLGESINLREEVVVGGMDMMTQALNLSRRPHIVIGTPGRVADLMRSSRDAICLKRVRFLVLDEADRLLTDSFSDDLEYILGELPSQRQTLLFSATMTAEVEALRSSDSTFYFKAQEKQETVEKLEQRYVLTPSLVRDSYLVWILKNICADKTVIIFIGKCKTCELVRFMLRQLGFEVTALHSQMTQMQRIASLARFRSGHVPILLATDIGSRGLDIPSVNIVLNYDVPCSATDYIHRVGRTARAGRDGKSITLVTEVDVDLIENIENRTRRKMEQMSVDEKEVNGMLKDVALAKHEASMHLNDIQFGEKKRLNQLKTGVVKKKLKKRK